MVDGVGLVEIIASVIEDLASVVDSLINLLLFSHLWCILGMMRTCLHTIKKHQNESIYIGKTPDKANEAIMDRIGYVCFIKE